MMMMYTYIIPQNSLSNPKKLCPFSQRFLTSLLSNFLRNSPMNQTRLTPMFSGLLDWFVNDPKILHFSWIEGQTPASSPQFISLTVVSYLSVTYFLSQNHPISIAPPILRRITVVHNLILIILSLVMLVGCLLSMFFHAPNLHYVLCYPENVEPKGPLFFWAYVFYLSKIYEYVDTFLIVVSKSMKRLSFLHVYHHATVVIMCYIGMHTSQSSFSVVVITNCAVHVFMYYYYLLCAIGKRPNWKRLVTDIQISQFALSFIDMLIVLFFHFTGSGCSGMWGFCFSMAFIITLLALFIDFHSKNYDAKKNK